MRPSRMYLAGQLSPPAATFTLPAHPQDQPTRHLFGARPTSSRRAELYDLSGVQHRGTLQRFPKVLRYIKLNYLCHDRLLFYEPLWRGWDAIQLSSSDGPTKPIRIDN